MKDINHQNLIGIITIILLILFSYWGAMYNGFVWDDSVYLTDRKLTTLKGLLKIWTQPSITDHPYYPLTHTSFWLEYHIWGSNPFGYHLVNIILHAINAIVVWLILRHLGIKGAWMCAAVFAVHPVHVESVAWITERKNLLSGMFYLLSVFNFLRFYFVPREKGKKGDLRLYILSVVLFIFSMLSKSAFCTLPIALLLIIWWKNNRITRSDARLLMPFFAVAAALGIFTIWMEKHHVGAYGAEWSFSLIERFLIASRALWFYAAKLIWPFELIFIYPRWNVNHHIWWQYLYLVGVAVVLAVLWSLREKIGKGPLVCVLLFATNLMPALGFINFYMMIFSFVADHLQYIASIGLIIMFVSWVSKCSANLGLEARRFVFVLCAIILILLSFRTKEQTRIYKNKITLYTDIINKNPSCWMAYNNRGRRYEARGEYYLAFKDYNKAIDINPYCKEGSSSTCAHLYNNRGIIYIMKEQYDLAIADFNKALSIEPNFVKPYLNRGVVYINQNDYKTALVNFNKAIEKDPEYVKGYIDRAAVYSAQGLFDLAMADYNKAIGIDPFFASTYLYRSKVLYKKGEKRRALTDALKARSLGFHVEESYIADLKSAMEKKNKL
jgi:tetratricopeptide (TPR) repeat protein